MLDIQQMFGRAGRPQFDDQGEASLITDINKLNAYMGIMNQARYLESRLQVMLNEVLNAEIVLGNVTSVMEAFDWIRRTFFLVRLKRSPISYGCRIMDVNPEVQIEIFINEMIERTLDRLDKMHLIRYDRKSLYLTSTELGRITSYYYVTVDTMEIFKREFHIDIEAGDTFEEFKQSKVDTYYQDIDVLKILAQAKEFNQIKFRMEVTAALRSSPSWRLAPSWRSAPACRSAPPLTRALLALTDRNWPS